MRLRVWMLTAVAALLIIGATLAGVALEKLGAPPYGSDAVVFVEHTFHTRGRLVSGAYPAETLSGAGYTYEAEKKAIQGSGLDANDTLRAVVGVSRSLVQDAGEGTAGEIHGVYALPSSVGDLRLEDVRPDGTVTLRYNGSEISLPPGARWERVFTAVASTPEYDIKLIRSDAIRNHGILPKSSIH